MEPYMGEKPKLRPACPAIIVLQSQNLAFCTSPLLNSRVIESSP